MNFKTTRWSLVCRFGNFGGGPDGDSGVAREALAGLCEMYWFPLYAFAIRSGEAPEAAADGVQGFFAYLLENRLGGGLALGAADPERGRFRAFLIGAFRHYRSDRRRYDRALKRGGDAVEIAWDAQEGARRLALEPKDSMTPDVLYEKQWALSVLDHAMRRLQRDYERAGKADLFSALKPFLTGDVARGDGKAAATKVGLSEGAARVAVHRLRRRLGEFLRYEVAQTVDREERVDPELRQLLAVLRDQ
ncbi:MAG: hypothetical protein AAGM22_23310 [Acidobacteriota bacterium]